MGNCVHEDFQRLIDWGLKTPKNFFQHVIGVFIVERAPNVSERHFNGTVSVLPASSPTPPLFIGHMLVGGASEESHPKNGLLITIGLSKPIIRVWMRFVSEKAVGQFVTLDDLGCQVDEGDLLVSGAGDNGKSYDFVFRQSTILIAPSARNVFTP